MIYFDQNLPKLNIIIGAGDQKYGGWISTHKEDLDLTNKIDWIKSFENTKADAFLCEHVWEHLSLEEGLNAAKYVYDSLKPNGFIRVAVPDANFPDLEYQNMVKVGGPGPADHPAADHKIVYNYKSLVSIFEQAGFKVDLLEYCDYEGRFHYHQWDFEIGPIYRSLMNDPRNKNGKINFVSLIIDAKK